jgi:hypothetical protein
MCWRRELSASPLGLSPLEVDLIDGLGTLALEA